MPSMTRGPLPARVYWFRRGLVLATAVLLVVAIARLLGNGSDASGGDAAQLAADGSTPTTSASTSMSAGTSAPATTAPATPATPRKSRSTAPALATPVGTCTGSDITVTPKVTNAVAGRDVMVVLELQTISAAACNWRVSPDALTVKLTSGKDRIWSSADCPRAIPRRDVVIRQAVATTVGVVWKQAKRSGSDCVTRTGWAMPGWYHATAAALGGEPADVQFELKAPTAVTITKTATPKQTPSQSPSGSATGKPSGKPSGNPSKPSHSPSGAVEPNG